MIHGRFHGVTIVKLSRAEGVEMLAYLGWTRMMYEKLIRPKATTESPTVKRLLSSVHGIETCIRMYIPGGGWTPVDALYHERLNQNNLLQPGAADEGLSILLGFSEEFIRSISSYPNLFSAPTVTRLCKSVDRRFPIREYHPKSATLEQRTHSIELVVQLFQILSGNNSGELSGANDRQLLYNQSTGLVEMLRISHDLKNIIAKIDHWTEVLGAERHVSKEFVTKTLNTRSICG